MMVLALLQSFGSRDNIPLVAAVAVLLAIALAFLAPAEATLGQAVKLVYIHAALMWVSFGMLTLAGVAGAAFLVTRRRGFLNWSSGSVAAAVTLLASTGLLGMMTAAITWGGVFWGEPRLKMLFGILILGGIAMTVGRLGSSLLLNAAANILFPVSAWWLLIRTELIIHPVSPIFTSDSMAIRIFPLLITASLAFAGLQLVRYWAPPAPASSSDKVPAEALDSAS